MTMDNINNTNPQNLPVSVAEVQQTLQEMMATGAFNDRVLDSLNYPILITDRQLNVVYMNNMAETMWGVKLDEVFGKSLMRANLQGIAQGLQKSLDRVVKEGKDFHLKALQYHDPSDEAHFIDLSYTPLRDGQGNLLGVISTGQEVTRQIVEQQKQLAYQQDLERKVEEKTQELERLQNDYQRYLNEIDQSLQAGGPKKDLLQTEAAGQHKFEQLIGQNPKMQKLYDLISKVAATDTTVLITGETGTGKELVARAIHEQSARKNARFVGVNCAAIPETLLESELFGHVKGAFTGAIRDKKGRFELADGGTIFLDEIGEMSRSIQSKLLRVLQEREFERVGGENTVQADVRVIAATNQSLEQMVAQGGFRQDLYYRLKVITIELPPLRERLNDLPLLVGHFVKSYSRKYNKNVDAISQSVMGEMLAYDWPGNVRELENVIERAVILATSSTIEQVELSASRRPLPNPALGFMSRDFISSMNIEQFMGGCERMYWLALFSRTGGNIKKISQLSGVNRRTIHNKMKKFSIRRQDFKSDHADHRNIFSL